MSLYVYKKNCWLSFSLTLIFRESSIQRLSVLQLSDCRFKQRPNRPTTLLEQFLRGKGLQAGLWTLLEENCRDLDDFQWRNTLLPLATTVGQLL